MEPGKDALEEVFELARWIEGLVPPFWLTPTERSLAARWLFGGDSEFVRFTARALQRHRHLFPDFPGDPHRLEEIGEHGDRLLEAAAHLQILSDRLKDQGLHHKSIAVEIAMSVMQQVRQDEALPFRDEQLAEDRRRALFAAERMLAARQKHNQRVRRLRERQREKKLRAAQTPGDEAR